VVDPDLERGRRTVSNAKRMPIVHVSREQYRDPAPQSATLILDISGQLCDKPQGLSLDDTLEGGMGK
jgi:hypothetical protein